MKEIQTNKGPLKYRLPDIAEGFTYLSMIDAVKTKGDVYRIKGRIIKAMGELIEYKSIGYLTYDEVLNDKENMIEALAEISGAILDDILELLGKKI